MRLLACLIVAPQRGYDEPAILSYAISSFCPTSADGLHPRHIVWLCWSIPPMHRELSPPQETQKRLDAPCNYKSKSSTQALAAKSRRCSLALWVSDPTRCWSAVTLFSLAGGSN